MERRFKRDRIILYISITFLFLVHWIYNDVESYPNSFGISLLNNLWVVVYVVGMNILYFQFALPVVLSGKINRAILIVLSILVHLIVFSVGLYVWREVGHSIGIYKPFRKYADAGRALAGAFRFTPGVFLLFAVFKLFFDYTQLKYVGQQARLEKKQAELLFLKSQINPHFLFNTLNNIYSLSQYQPHLVSESVIRLSKILRYLLYDASHEFIAIDKELKILTDYIDLEKLRYNETVTIEFHSDIDDLTTMIPPLLLIPLVENAFKHGVSTSRGTRFVNVTCSLKQKKLNFVVKNSIPAVGYEQSTDNIGLSNLRRRLNLLYKDFKLVAEKEESAFLSDLKINLSSYV
jgi:two-component system, LytTR family, sensor kinase